MSERGRVRGSDGGRDGEVGGEGVKTYDTQGGGGARESLKDAEQRGGDKPGEGETRGTE